MKPYRLDDRKSSKQSLTEIDLSQWKEVIVSNIKAEAEWKPLLNRTWKEKKITNRGFGDESGDEKDATNLDSMLTFIATYGPSSVFREITQRSTSMTEVWEVIRKWAGLRTSGSKHLTYSKLKRSYDPTSNQSPQEFYYALRDAKEDCLLLANSNIKFKGKTLAEDEELIPCIESDVVMDWLEAIGGPALQDHVFRLYSKDLEAGTLADLQERISENMETLLAESENATDGAASISRVDFRNRDRKQSRPRKESRQNKDRDQYFNAKTEYPKKSGAPCPLCKAKGRPQANSHGIADCRLLGFEDRKAIAKIHKVFKGKTAKEEQKTVTFPSSNDDDDDNEDDVDSQQSSDNNE